MTRYAEPGWFTKNVFNRTVAALARLGVSVAGAHELRVRGRKSGKWRATPVNVMTVDGRRYLVAPRGTTQWVRNIRVTPEAQLRVGRRVEQVRATEVGDADKPPVLRYYIRRWYWEVGQFFEGVDKNPTEEQVARIAPDFPVFELAESRPVADR